MNIKKDEIIEMKENSNYKQKWEKASYMTNEKSTYKQSRLISQKKFYNEVMNINIEKNTIPDTNINTPDNGLILEKWINSKKLKDITNVCVSYNCSCKKNNSSQRKTVYNLGLLYFLMKISGIIYSNTIFGKLYSLFVMGLLIGNAINYTVLYFQLTEPIMWAYLIYISFFILIPPLMRKFLKSNWHQVLRDYNNETRPIYNFECKYSGYLYFYNNLTTFLITFILLSIWAYITIIDLSDPRASMTDKITDKMKDEYLLKFNDTQLVFYIISIRIIWLFKYLHASCFLSILNYMTYLYGLEIDSFINFIVKGIKTNENEEIIRKVLVNIGDEKIIEEDVLKKFNQEKEEDDDNEQDIIFKNSSRFQKSAMILHRNIYINVRELNNKIGILINLAIMCSFFRVPMSIMMILTDDDKKAYIMWILVSLIWIITIVSMVSHLNDKYKKLSSSVFESIRNGVDESKVWSLAEYFKQTELSLKVFGLTIDTAKLYRTFFLLVNIVLSIGAAVLQKQIK